MRGAVASRCLYQPRAGIIPARAGSSVPRSRPCRPGGDHPRACGEQCKQWRARAICLGSSPRVRGAAIAVSNVPAKAGIIPARAGSRFASGAGRQSTRDHPRACGEQDTFANLTVNRKGSSPRVRGAALTRAVDGALRGIIPARTGSRSAAHVVSYRLWDHPRACGEQLTWAEIHNDETGSSPRVRGAGLDSRRRRVGSGIIPARAGSRLVQPRLCNCQGDHPRACGEQWLSLTGGVCRSGSSPRVRGAVAPHVVRYPSRGIIPARAGSS